MCKDFSHENRPIWAARPRIPYIYRSTPPPPGLEQGTLFSLPNPSDRIKSHLSTAIHLLLVFLSSQEKINPNPKQKLCNLNVYGQNLPTYLTVPLLVGGALGTVTSHLEPTWMARASLSSSAAFSAFSSSILACSSGLTSLNRPILFFSLKARTESRQTDTLNVRRILLTIRINSSKKVLENSSMNLIVHISLSITFPLSCLISLESLLFVFKMIPYMLWKWNCMESTLPYSDKRKQLSKITFLVNEQNMNVMCIDINAISSYLDMYIFQQDELWLFLLQTRKGSRISQVQSKNITFSDLGDLSVASFCQSRAVHYSWLWLRVRNQILQSIMYGLLFRVVGGWKQ